MAYLTLSQFEKRIGAADLDKMFSDLSEAERDEAIVALIAAGGDELEGYCSSRYVIPLAETDQVQRYVSELAKWMAWSRKPWNMTEAERDAEKMLRKQLEQVATRKFALKGQAELGTLANQTSVRATDPAARTSGRARSFTREKLSGM